jgi:hypothetical protein
MVFPRNSRTKELHARGRQRRPAERERFMAGAHKRTDKEKIKQILLQLHRQLEIDERKYAPLLDEKYYHGYVDGQKRAIRLIEQMAQEER